MSNSLPNTFYTLILFCLATIGYFVYKYYYNNNEEKFPDLDSDNSSKKSIFDKKWMIGITILYGFVIYLIFVLVNIVNSGLICDSPQYGSVLYATTISCFVMFFCLIFLLNTFKSWLIPFSNTIGYGIVNSFTNLPKFIITLNPLTKTEGKSKGIPINEEDEKNLVNIDQNELKDEIKKVYGDPALIINKFNIKNFDRMWNYYKDNIFSIIKLSYLIKKACGHDDGLGDDGPGPQSSDGNSSSKGPTSQTVSHLDKFSPAQKAAVIAAAVVKYKGKKGGHTKGKLRGGSGQLDDERHFNGGIQSEDEDQHEGEGQHEGEDQSALAVFKSDKILKQFLEWYTDYSIKDPSNPPDMNETIKEICKDISKLDKEILPSFIKYTFKSYIKIKDLISEFIWYFLTGYLTITTIYNYIVNKPCYTSPDVLKKAHQDHVALEKKNANIKNKVDQSNIVYKITE